MKLPYNFNDKQKAAIIVAGLLLIAFFYSYGSQFFTLKKTEDLLSEYQIRELILDDSIATLNRKIEYLSGVIDRYEIRIAELSKSLKQKTEEAERLKKEIPSLKGKIRRLQNEKQTLEEELSQAVVASRVNEERAVQLQHAIDSFENRLSVLQAETDRITSALVRTSGLLESETNEKVQLENQLSELEQIQQTELTLTQIQLFNAKGVKIHNVSMKRWKASSFEVLVRSENQNLQGKYFGIEIINVANHKPVELEVQDVNISSATMVIQQLNGDKLYVEMKNRSKVAGKLFKLNIYYIPDPANLQIKYLLNNNNLFFVSNGKVVEKNT